MNHTVAGAHVGKRDVSVVHHHTVTDREGEWLSVDSGGRHAIRDVGGWNFSTDDVVEQNVRQGRFAFGCIESSEVDTGVSKRLVGRSKDGERPRPLERLEQFRLDDTGHQ